MEKCTGHDTDMTTSSNGTIFRVTDHLCGEFTGEFPPQRPVTRSFDVFFDPEPEQSDAQTVETPVIRDAITLIMTPLL